MSAKVRLSSTIAAIRRGSRSRETSRRSARRKTPARRRVAAIDDVGQVDDDPPASTRRARDGLQTGRWRSVAHRGAFSHGAVARRIDVRGRGTDRGSRSAILSRSAPME